MNYLYYLSLIFIFIGLVLLFITWLKRHNNDKTNLIKHSGEKYAVLIPARDESSVIEELLISLVNNQVNFQDVYVIVENKNDKTIDITHKYGGNIFIRTDLEKRHRKGFALDEVIKDILSKKKEYDLYFIFDADNVIKKHFFEEMVKTYHKGYKIATGYRNIKNSQNAITTCSGLTFSMINTLINKKINKIHGTIIISGTGYFIAGDLIKKWQGFPFNTLTEDYELSLYASANSIATYYNELAEFEDEQPLKWKMSIKQRTRWVKGFFEARKKRLNEIKDDYMKLLGITPILFILIGIVSFIIFNIGKLFESIIINNKNYLIYLKYIILSIMIVYIVLMIFTIILLRLERNRLNISNRMKIKALFVNPLFLLSYIYCFIKSFNKNITWETIKHGKQKLD